MEARAPRPERHYFDASNTHRDISQCHESIPMRHSEGVAVTSPRQVIPVGIKPWRRPKRSPAGTSEQREKGPRGDRTDWSHPQDPPFDGVVTDHPSPTSTAHPGDILRRNLGAISDEAAGERRRRQPLSATTTLAEIIGASQ